MRTSQMKTSSAPIITRLEWRFVWLMILLVLGLTSILYLYGALSTPPDQQFMGLMFNVPDHAQYLSWWRGFQSELIIPNKLTPEANQPIFFNLQWWLLAKFSQLTGTGYPLAYQVLRLVAGIGLFVTVYRLAAVIFPDAARRRAAFLMVTLMSGFGWVFVALKYALGGDELFYPLLVYAAEANYFLCLLGSPHFALAAMLICLVLEFVLRAWRQNSIALMCVAGGIAFVLGWMHAYDLLIIYGVAGAFFLTQWLRQRKFPLRLFWGTALLGVISVAPALYSFLLTSLDPLWKEVLAQFANAGVYTPQPHWLFFLYGLPLFLAVAGLVFWAQEKRWTDERVFVTVWFVVGFLLLYIPTDFQIHMLNSWQIPMCILATAAVYDRIIPALARRFSGRRLGWNAAQWTMAAIILLMIPTNVYLYAWRFVELQRHTYPYYMESDYTQALDWITRNGSPEERVLASEEIGQYIPALTNNYAFLAHWANTVQYYDKRQRVKDFYSAETPDPGREDTVGRFGVNYVLFGPAEAALGSFRPTDEAWLSLVFHTPKVDVYRVADQNLPDFVIP